MNKKPTYEELEKQLETFDAVVLENQKIRAKLLKTQERLLGLAEFSPTALLVYQNDRFIYGNKAVETISGYSIRDMIHMNFWDIVHPDHRALVRERGQIRQRGETTVNRYEFKIVAKDGTEKWVDLAGTTTLIGGRPAGVVSVTDITDRKRTEDALRASEVKFRTLAETATDIIVFLNEKMQIDYLSSAVTKSSGYTVEEILAKPFQELITQSSYEMAMVAFDEEMANIAGGAEDHPGIRKIELETICKDASTRWMEVILNPIWNQDKQFTGMLGLSRDITERKRAEEERHRLISEREKALSEIKILSGMLPICAMCKKIRNDEGYWEQIENYIRDHSGAEFTHGICPDCIQKHYSRPK